VSEFVKILPGERDLQATMSNLVPQAPQVSKEFGLLRGNVAFGSQYLKKTRRRLRSPKVAWHQRSRRSLEYGPGDQQARCRSN